MKAKLQKCQLKKQQQNPLSHLLKRDKLVLNNIDTLKIRSAKKVASALGIKQKANGVDKSLKCLQQEIRQQLESDYRQVAQALQLAKVG